MVYLAWNFHLLDHEQNHRIATYALVNPLNPFRGKLRKENKVLYLYEIFAYIKSEDTMKKIIMATALVVVVTRNTP